MTRSILLGLLTTTIISITLGKAIATSNTEVISQPENKSLNLDSSSQTSNINSQKISSKVWLQDVAGILLSGSMFQKCQPRQKLYFGQNIFQKSVQNSADPGCIFPWQDSFDDEIDILDKSQTFLSTNPTDNLDISSSLTQSTALPQTPIKFPKLSRSSLIVDFPTANSTFKPKNTKLANPAPETERIASPFGWRRRPYSYQLQFHQGVDYGAPLGSPVVAVGDGIVTRVVSGCYDFGNLYCGGQLGNWIEIDHGNGAIGTYGHLKNSSIVIKEGMKVWKNQEIAQVGSSGWSTGAHLDFRMKVNGEYEDPAKHLTPPDY